MVAEGRQVTMVTPPLTIIVSSLALVMGESVHSPVLGGATQIRRDYTVFSHNKVVSKEGQVRWSWYSGHSSILSDMT